MRKLLIAVVCPLAALAFAPAALAADFTPHSGAQAGRIQLVVDGGWFFADKERTVLVRNVTISGKTFITPQEPSKQNPAKLCAAQRTGLDASAFNELWGRNAYDRNASGKCVSAMAKAKKKGVVVAAQSAIIDAAKTRKAEGSGGARLGALRLGARRSAGDEVRPTN